MACWARAFAILIFATGTAVRAADDISVYDGVAYRITLPGKWTQRAGDTAVSYRNTSRSESVTVGVYGFARGPLDDAARRKLMLESAALRRAAERDLADGALRISAANAERDGKLLRLRYTGAEASGRRFANLMISSPRWLQNFYYEAVGMAPQDFSRASELIFAKLQVREPMPRQTVYACGRIGIRCVEPSRDFGATEAGIADLLPLHLPLPLLR